MARRKQRLIDNDKYGNIELLIICSVITLLLAGTVWGINAERSGREQERDNGSVASRCSFVETIESPRQAIISLGETTETIYVCWTGEKAGPRMIRVSEDRDSLPDAVPVRAVREKILSGNTYRYNAKITNIKHGRKYYYEIGDGVSYDEPAFFNVPDEGANEDVFAYMGDPQFGTSIKDYEAWERLTKDMYAKDPDIEFALAGGDLVNVPTRRKQWEAFLGCCDVFSRIPLMTAPGNHEGVASNNTYKKIFHHVCNGPEGEAFYWFEKGNCRFLMLDSSFFTKARQLAMGMEEWEDAKARIAAWMRTSLEESEKTWNIAVVHHPVYGLHDVFTTSPEIRECWLPILKEGDVDLVLCGHQHVYMRSRPMDGIVYLMGVSGSRRSKYYSGANEPAYSETIYAGGPNYQIIRTTEDELTITAYNEKGSIIDAACISKDSSLPYFQTFW